MRRYLYVNSPCITCKPYPDIIECSAQEYWKRRIKFWQWRLHKTMGWPILVLRQKGEQ